MNARKAVRFLAVPLALLLPSLAWAQGPWTPAKGEFYFTPTYQYLDGGDHLLAEEVVPGLGKAVDAGQVQSNAFVIDGDLGVTDRLAINGAVVFVASRYLVGGIGSPEGDIDDGTWNSGFQDARIGARYMLFSNEAVTLTPFAYWGFPTNAYTTLGHASIGTNIKELRVGLDWGLVFAGLPRAFMTGAASYAFMDNPDEIPIDRTNLSVAFGYIFRHFSVVAATDYQATHGGLDWVDDLLLLEPDHPDRGGNLHAHDRAADADFLRLGAGLSVPIGLYWEAFAHYSTTVWGINTHRGSTFTTGATWRFRLFGGTDWW